MSIKMRNDRSNKKPKLRLSDVAGAKIDNCLVCNQEFDTNTGRRFHAHYVCPGCIKSIELNSLSHSSNFNANQRKQV